MPIYAYKCASCGHAQDVLRKISDPPLVQCPACGADTFQKQVTAAGFQLKGSGWYATDFKGSPPAAPAGDKAGSDKAAGDKAGGDAKPADAAAKPAKSADGAASTPAPAKAPAPAPTSGGGSSST